MLRLHSLLQKFGQVTMEFGYRAQAEFEYRVAEVAAISWDRWNGTDPEDNLRGAPELVVEVKSPSNTRAELRETASLCLANGCLEFWVVDLDARSITVTRQDGSTSMQASGDSLPLAAFGADTLPVSQVFSD